MLAWQERGNSMKGNCANMPDSDFSLFCIAPNRISVATGMPWLRENIHLVVAVEFSSFDAFHHSHWLLPLQILMPSKLARHFESVVAVNIGSRQLVRWWCWHGFGDHAEGSSFFSKGRIKTLSFGDSTIGKKLSRICGNHGNSIIHIVLLVM